MSNFQFGPDQMVDELVQFNQNLSKGVKNLLDADEISSGVTPREVIYAEDKLKLYRYQPSTGVVQNKTPMLIVYALVNRPYMMDIQENRSPIKGLLDSGQDVYLIDWGIPRAEDAHLTLEDYVLEFLPECVSQVQRQTNETDVNVVGYCLGGLLAVLHEALQPESPCCCSLLELKPWRSTTRGSGEIPS